MAILILVCVLCALSAITGIQSFHFGSRTDTVVTYHHGYSRFYALALAAANAIAFYGVYRRTPVAWKIGWVVLVLAPVSFIIRALPSAIHQQYGKFGATIGVVLGAIFVAVYWAFWWNRQKSYFTGQRGQEV